MFNVIVNILEEKIQKSNREFNRQVWIIKIILQYKLYKICVYINEIQYFPQGFIGFSNKKEMWQLEIEKKKVKQRRELKSISLPFILGREEES